MDRITDRITDRTTDRTTDRITDRITEKKRKESQKIESFFGNTKQKIKLENLIMLNENKKCCVTN